MPAFGDQLREWRRRRFWTQRELAAQIPVSTVTVQRWEAGQNLPYPAQQRRLTEVLGVDPDEFLAALKAAEEERGKVAA